MLVLTQFTETLGFPKWVAFEFWKNLDSNITGMQLHVTQTQHLVKTINPYLFIYVLCAF